MVREVAPELGFEPLEVPHPSYNLWNRHANDEALQEIRRLFSAACPE